MSTAYKRFLQSMLSDIEWRLNHADQNYIQQVTQTLLNREGYISPNTWITEGMTTDEYQEMRALLQQTVNAANAETHNKMRELFQNQLENINNVIREN
jgi:hypothetical protein